MGLFEIFNSSMNLYNQTSNVKNTRNEILLMKERLRGTPQFSNTFYSIIPNVERPPKKIEASQSGDFWTESWDLACNNYEPYTTLKFQDRNIAYIECCAIFLLIQDCYPNVYIFPNNSISEIQNGAFCKLIMQAPYVSKIIKPAIVPPSVSNMENNIKICNDVKNKFCVHCGTKIIPGVNFCGICGTKIEN